MNTKRRALPVLLERDFRKLAASEGATVSPAGERFLLVTALARERIVNSPIGMFGLAFGKLNLDHLDVPAVAGAVCTGMRSRPGGSDPLE